MSSDSALTPVPPFVKTAGLIAALLFSGGCETAVELVELIDLLDGLVEEFDFTPETVGLKLSHSVGTTTVGGTEQALDFAPSDAGILTVTVTDSITLELPDEAKYELMIRIAGFIRDHFELYEELVRVRVSFTEVQSSDSFFGLVQQTTTTNRGTVDFSTDSLELHLAVRQGADLVELGRPEEALAVLDAALRLDPNFSLAQGVRAAALLMLEPTAEAAPTDELAAADPPQPRSPLGPEEATQPPIPLGPGEPTFTPMTARPEIINVAEIEQALMSQYPPILRVAGIGGVVTVWFFVSEEGRVLDRRVAQSSGQARLDEAALNVADVFQFTPALNEEQPVSVWIQIPLTFQVR